MALKTLAQALQIAWASPASLCGLLLGATCLLAGGHVRRLGPTLEFWGRGVPRVFRLVPFTGPIRAITLGHVILGIDLDSLVACRQHELVHVRQYQRWGPFFIPAYLLCSFWLKWRGRDAYFDNPFEREAFALTSDGD